MIYVEEQRYRVMVNGLQQATMSHRAPPSLVDTLVVRGDLFINHVSIAKSGPAPERLPSPGSPTGSLISFVHIPEEISIQHMPSIENCSASTKILPSTEPGLSQSNCHKPEFINSPTLSVEEEPSTSMASPIIGSEIMSSVSTFKSKPVASTDSDSSSNTTSTIVEKTENFQPTNGSGSSESSISGGVEVKRKGGQDRDEA